jgi:hypothetical protein
MELTYWSYETYFFISVNLIIKLIKSLPGTCCSVVVKTLCYKPEGLGFEI